MRIRNYLQQRLGFASLVLLIAISLTLVYWNHFDNVFHFDDMHTIVNNDYVTEIRNLPLFFTDSQTFSSLPENQTYRPMVTSLNAIDYWLAGGLNPKVFHWHIFIEFLLLLVLMYWLVKQIYETSSGKKHPYLALIATSFFAFHTATAETVNYIIARSDGFSTLMVLVAMNLFIANRGWNRQWGLIPFIIGCLTKLTTLMLAPILLAYSLMFESPSLTVKNGERDYATIIRRSVLTTASFFVIGAFMYVLARSMAPNWVLGGTSTTQYLNTQPYVIWFYIKTFVLPTGLSADTDLRLIEDILAPKVLWGLMVNGVAIFAALIFSKRRNTLPISFGILWFYISLIPTSSIIPLAEVMNHHRTFFPYIGLVMATTWGGYLLFDRCAQKFSLLPVKICAGIVVVLTLSLHAYGTYQRNEVWDSSASLWFDVTVKSPGNGRGLMNYGLSQMRVGKFEEAIDNYYKARETDYGNHPYLFVNLAIATDHLSQQSNDAQLQQRAEEYYKKSVELGPNYPQTHYLYADWLLKKGKLIESKSHVEKALELSPAHKAARLLLKNIDLTAENEFKLANSNSQENAETILNLSLKYYRLGRYDLSLEAAAAALDRRPDYTFAYNNICVANIQLNKFRQAIAACEKALQLDPNYQLAQNNLRWARQAAEDFEK